VGGVGVEITGPRLRPCERRERARKIVTLCKIAISVHSTQALVPTRPQEPLTVRIALPGKHKETGTSRKRVESRSRKTVPVRTAFMLVRRRCTRIVTQGSMAKPKRPKAKTGATLNDRPGTVKSVWHAGSCARSPSKKSRLRTPLFGGWG